MVRKVSKPRTSTSTVETTDNDKNISQIDQDLSELESNSGIWAATNAEERIKILEKLVKIAAIESENLVNSVTARRVKEVDNPENSCVVNQCRISSPLVWNCWITELLHLWRNIKDTGCPPTPFNIRRGIDGGYICTVGPFDWTQYLLVYSMSYELHLPPGVPVSQNSPLTKPKGIVGVLGAGNYESPIDILMSLFIDNCVCMYKFNPLVTKETEDVFIRLCAPLVEKNIVKFCRGGSAEGEKIIQDPRVTKWVMTGGENTFNQIVWGDNERPAKLKTDESTIKESAGELAFEDFKSPEPIYEFSNSAASSPDHQAVHINSNLSMLSSATSKILDNGSDNSQFGSSPKTHQVYSKKINPVAYKKFTAELGGCTCVIVPPENFSTTELKAHAEHISFFSIFNGTHICVRPQCIITYKDWPQREDFLNYVQEAIENTPAWDIFYPKSDARHEYFRKILEEEGHQNFELNEIHRKKQYPNCRPFLFARNVSIFSKTIKEESFCPLLVEVPLDTSLCSELVLKNIYENNNSNNIFSSKLIEYICAKYENENDEKRKKMISKIKSKYFFKNQIDPQIYNNNTSYTLPKILQYFSTSKKSEVSESQYSLAIDLFFSASALFVNKYVHGNLACNIISSFSSPTISRSVDVCVLLLQHGVISININAVNVLGIPSLQWGAGKNSTFESIKSGKGYFGNMLGFHDKSGLKSVIKGNPFTFGVKVQTSGKEKWRREMLKRVTEAQLGRTEGILTSMKDIFNVIAARFIGD